MKRFINIIILFVAFIMIIGCENTNSNKQSKNNGSLPASSESATVKDDTYYENLIKDIKYPEIYGVKSDANLMNIAKLFVCTFDIIMPDDQFSSPQELGDENIFYYLTSKLHDNEIFESQEIEKTVDENFVFFYKQETIEKYAYYFFNYKIDCTKLEGWSEEKQGIFREMEGFGGGRPEPECQLNEIEPGKYQFTAVFKYGDNDSDDYTLTAILGVEKARVYLISLKRVYNK